MERLKTQVAAWPGGVFKVAGALLSAAVLAFFVVPICLLFVGLSPAELWAGLREPAVSSALRISLTTTLTSLLAIIICGTPLAWWMARSDSRLSRWVEPLTQLPIVVPPAVAGLALLFTFGARGPLGGVLESLGLRLVLTPAAVVLAQIFVAMPFYLQAALSAFRALDESYLQVARTLGASPARVFFSVALPLSGQGLLAGGALAWARAFGEFGATLMFAGSATGQTQTLPLAIYNALEGDLRTARVLAVLLILCALVLFGVVRWAAPVPGTAKVDWR